VRETKKLNVDPQVKNSAIYNKYFKNYKDPNEVIEVKVPKTKEELRKMLIEEHIKRIEAQKRIAQIKSKKMFFFGGDGPPGPQRTIYSSQNQQQFNQLFKFK
jgi:alanyl-tRNA synthetase